MTDFNSMPQPRTFAPSKEDVLQNLQYFFGAPVSPEKLKDYSEHHAMTYHFPDAYSGQNTKIRDTLNNLILKSPQNWQTSVRQTQLGGSLSWTIHAIIAQPPF